MKLAKLIADTALKVAAGDMDKDILQVDFDSRQVKAASLFVAVRGTQTDGHNYIQSAIDKGAVAVIAEKLPGQLSDNVCYLIAENGAIALAKVAANYYGNPSRQLKLVGVTGTNGKTTVATLLYDLFSALGYRSGLLSTVENRIGEERKVATHTTPDAIAIHALLAEMLHAGCDYAFMEVSSHALDQDRTAGLQFSGAIFTNMSHDHLDYHGSFAAYIEAKKKFFDNLDSNAFALINMDDKRGEVMIQNTKASTAKYSLRALTDFRAKVLDNSTLGLHMTINNREVYTRLIGEFNAYNLLAAYGTAMLMQQDENEVLAALSNLNGAEGRLSYLNENRLGLTGVVDYAHTPDALEKVLKTLRELRRDQGRIITVVGAGGDRDRAKRPEMARIGAKWSDRLILTSDNPRSEDPQAIIDEMVKGLDQEQKMQTLLIADRASAIRTAVQMSQRDDVILVAGKGHEKYQEIKGEKYPFDDHKVLQEAFLALK